jgi:hypothetical protein
MIYVGDTVKILDDGSASFVVGDATEPDAE